jgi:hypothetical protein
MPKLTWNMPPFPRLESADDGQTWEGKIVLRSWVGFLSRPKPPTSLSALICEVLRGWMGRGRPWVRYGSGRGGTPTDDTADLTVWSGELTGSGIPAGQSSPTPEQTRAFQYLMKHQVAVRDHVLGAILSEYQSTRESIVASLDAKEAEDQMPEIDSLEQLRPLIGELHVHVLPTAKGGVAYVGYDFGCTWDAEHGIGVMTHRDRVVDVGDGAAASLEWAAEEDAGSNT